MSRRVIFSSRTPATPPGQEHVEDVVHQVGMRRMARRGG